jgi:hypothetical protein
MAGSLLNLHAGPKEDATAAAKALSEKSYSWKTTTENAGGGGGGGGGGGRGGFGGGPQEGKIGEDGFATVTITGAQNTTEAVAKGGKVAVKREEGWQTLDEIAANAQGGGGGGGRGRGGTFALRNFKAPAGRALDLLGMTKELTAADGVISGDLTEEGAKSLLAFGGRGGGGGAEISGAKGSIKLWVKDGVLSKLETKVKGTVSFNGNDRDIDRTTTTEIKDVGTTKVTVPEEAKKKIS